MNSMNNSEGLSDKYKGRLFAGYMVAGILYQFVLIMQIYYNDGRYQDSFYHPSIQLLIIFLSMAPSYLIFRKKKMDGAIEEEPGKQKATIKIFIIPTLLLLLVFNFYQVCRYFIVLSILNIGQGMTIIFAFIFSISLLKIKIQKNHKIGGFLVIAGTLVVLLANQIYYQFPIVYQIIFLLLAFIINGYFYYFQHFLFHKYSINPFQMAGSIGIIGIPLTLIQILIMSYIPCDYHNYYCVLNGDSFYFENPSGFIDFMFRQPINFFFVAWTFGIIFVYTQCSFRITKYYGGVSNTIMIAAQMPIFWIINVFLTLITDGRFQVLVGWLIFMKIAGFIILIIGVLIYFQKFIKFGGNPAPQIITQSNESRISDAGRARLLSENE